jgi:hypothetical protein
MTNHKKYTHLSITSDEEGVKTLYSSTTLPYELVPMLNDEVIVQIASKSSEIRYVSKRAYWFTDEGLYMMRIETSKVKEG